MRVQAFKILSAGGGRSRGKKCTGKEGGDSRGGSRDGKRVERERGVNKRSVQWGQKRRTKTKEKKTRIRRQSCLCLSPQMPADACSVNTGRATIRI